jgi:hypothetical protein
VSTYYNLECVTCGKESRDLGNHVDKQILALAAEWPAIKDALALIDRLSKYVDAELSIMRPNFYEFSEFMRDHADHQIVLASEYGDKDQLLVGGSPALSIKVVSCESMPDGMWAFVKNGKIVASNFETRPPGYCDEAAAVVTNADACGRCASCTR